MGGTLRRTSKTTLWSYDSRLGELGLRDLDGLMLEALEVDVSGRCGFTYLLVDEFQDINPGQHARCV